MSVTVLSPGLTLRYRCRLGDRPARALRGCASGIRVREIYSAYRASADVCPLQDGLLLFATGGKSLRVILVNE